VDEHAHPQSTGESDHFAADGAVADDADGAALELAAHARFWNLLFTVMNSGSADAARQVHQEAEHQLADRSDEAGARLRHQHAGLARRGDVDVADIDRAAQEGDEPGQALEQRGRPGRLPVGDDELAVFRRFDEGISLQGFGSRVQLHLTRFPQGGQCALAVIVRHRLRRMGEEDLQAAFCESAASLR
jgi:hypothetical protein